MVTVIAEYTDLFGGQPNYSSVNRVEFDATDLTDRQVVIKAKKLLSLTCYPMRRVVECGDYIQLNSASGLSALLITWNY